MSLYAQEPNIESTTLADAAGVNIATVSAAGALKIDGSAVTQPVSAAALPLPTGASTAALQTTGNTSLASIDAGIPAALGQTTMTASMPVAIASNQSTLNVLPVGIGPLYTTSFSKTAIGVTELMALLLKNPNASGKTVTLETITVTNSHTVAGSWIRWRVYASPTISANGTANSVFTFAIGSGNTSVVTAFSTPTITANGSLLYDCTIVAGGSFTYTFPIGGTIAANNNLLVTAVADSTSRVGQVTVVWTES
jgi:hypothetical protein